MFEGAADCASCVGVLLEVARALVSDPTMTLPGPVLFLLNGGEETIMQVWLLTESSLSLE